MSSKPFLVITALIIALLITILIVRNAEDKTVNVFVASHDLAAGTEIKPNDIKTTRIASERYDSRFIIANDANQKQLLEQELTVTVAANQPLTYEQLKPIDGGPFARQLPADMVAISIPLTAANGNSRLISAGDHIDLLLTRSFPNAGDNKALITQTILNNLMVLGSQANSQRTSTNNDENKFFANLTSFARTRNTSSQFLTLAVTGKQAQIIAQASSVGSLTYVVRSTKTDSETNFKNYTLSNELNELSEPPPHAVTIIRGTTINQSNLEAPLNDN